MQYQYNGAYNGQYNEPPYNRYSYQSYNQYVPQFPKKNPKWNQIPLYPNPYPNPYPQAQPAQVLITPQQPKAIMPPPKVNGKDKAGPFNQYERYQGPGTGPQWSAQRQRDALAFQAAEEHRAQKEAAWAKYLENARLFWVKRVVWEVNMFEQAWKLPDVSWPTNKTLDEIKKAADFNDMIYSENFRFYMHEMAWMITKAWPVFEGSTCKKTKHVAKKSWKSRAFPAKE